MPRAVIVGGTGLIGRATALRLLESGWSVEVTGRDPARMPAEVAAAGGRFHRAERADAGRLAEVLGDGADLLVDCLCHTAADARRMLPLLGRVACPVMISSRAVYVDAAGRHVNSAEPPRFGGPVSESGPTLAPGDGDPGSRAGYGPNKVAAERVLLDSGAPVTVLRPARVHGVGAARPAEWVFVRRVLDRRPAVLLARAGTGVAQGTAAVELAALVETVAAAPGARVLNCADPDAPSARQVARLVAERLNHRWREVLLDEPDDGVDAANPDDAAGRHETALGRTPWHARHPLLLDTTAARALGHVPVGGYRATVGAKLDWLAAVGRRPGWSPADREWFTPYFDYPAEDRWLASEAARTRTARSARSAGGNRAADREGERADG